VTSALISSGGVLALWGRVIGVCGDMVCVSQPTIFGPMRGKCVIDLMTSDHTCLALVRVEAMDDVTEGVCVGLLGVRVYL